MGGFSIGPLPPLQTTANSADVGPGAQYYSGAATPGVTSLGSDSISYGNSTSSSESPETSLLTAFQQLTERKNVQVGIFLDDNGENSGTSSSAGDSTNHQTQNRQTITDARAVSAASNNVHINSTQVNTEQGAGENLSVDTTIDKGVVTSSSTGPGEEPTKQKLTNFVTTTLDNAQKNDASAVLEIGGHGNPLSSLLDSSGNNLTADDLATAIKDGEAAHAKEHPEDAQRKIDTVVLDQCDGDSTTRNTALHDAGVKTVIASSNSTYGINQSFLPLLADPQGNATTIAQKAAQAQGPNPQELYIAQPGISVQQLDNGKTEAVDDAESKVHTSISDAIKADPSQKDAILKAFATVPQESTTADLPDGSVTSKNGIAAYSALANATDVAAPVKDAAQHLVDALKASTIGQANNSPPYQGVLPEGSDKEVGPSVISPTPDYAKKVIASGTPVANWVTSLYT